MLRAVFYLAFYGGLQWVCYLYFLDDQFVAKSAPQTNHLDFQPYKWVVGYNCSRILTHTHTHTHTHTQWVHNFRMSEETFICLCAKLCPAMEKHDTNFRVSIPLKKRVPSHYGSWQPTATIEVLASGHLFGVRKKTVCRCVQEFCEAACKWFVPEQICFPDKQKLKEMAALRTNGGFHSVLVPLMGHTYIPIIAPKEYRCDCFNRKGWHSIILQGVVDGKGLYGVYMREWLGVCMMLGLWDCPHWGS